MALPSLWSGVGPWGGGAMSTAAWIGVVLGVSWVAGCCGLILGGCLCAAKQADELQLPTPGRWIVDIDADGTMRTVGPDWAARVERVLPEER